MREPRDNQRNFMPLFVMAMVADFLARTALATGDDVWEHLAMIWTGPLDDIMFGLAGIQAFLYLLDPRGEKTIDPNGGHNHKMVLKALKTGGEETLSVNFIRGNKKALMLLPALLTVFLVTGRFLDNPMAQAAVSLSQQHLSYMFPVSLAVVFLFAMLRLGGLTANYWKALGLAGACLFVSAALDGRWQNHLYHMVANLENLLAWTVTFGWAGFLAAISEDEAG